MENVDFVANMIKRAGGEALILYDPDIVLNEDKLLLPRVGAFDVFMSRLK